MTRSSPIREYDPFSAGVPGRPVPGVPVDARRGAGVLQREVELVGAVAVRRRPRGRPLDPDTYLSFEGIDIDDTAKDQNPPGFLPRRRQPPPRPDPRGSCSRHLLPGRIAEREDAVRGVGARARSTRWRDRGERRPGPGAGLADAQRGVLRPARAARVRARTARELERWVHELKDRKPDDARLTPVAKAATEGIRSPTSSTCSNERRREPRADLMTHHRPGGDRRGAAGRGGHRAPRRRSWA